MSQAFGLCSGVLPMFAICIRSFYWEQSVFVYSLMNSSVHTNVALVTHKYRPKMVL